MLKLVNLVVVPRAKAELILRVDQVNVYQVRHLRLPQKCQQVKKRDLNVPKQAVRR